MRASPAARDFYSDPFRPGCSGPLRCGPIAVASGWSFACVSQEEVTKWRRIENGGIQEGGEIGQVSASSSLSVLTSCHPQVSVSHFELLGLARELIEYLPTLGVGVLLVPQHILETDAPMRSDHAERKLLLLKKLDQERS